MKHLLLIILISVTLTSISQKFEAYKFTNETDLRQSAASVWLVIPDKITSEMQFRHDEGETIAVHYIGQIVTNYPKTDSTWVAEISEDVYLIAYRKGDVKLPSNKKVTGNDRKYIWKYIAKFAGETEP